MWDPSNHQFQTAFGARARDFERAIPVSQVEKEIIARSKIISGSDEDVALGIFTLMGIADVLSFDIPLKKGVEDESTIAAKKEYYASICGDLFKLYRLLNGSAERTPLVRMLSEIINRPID